jgi:hypothetical protein
MSLVPGTGADANETPSESTQLLREHVDNYATLRAQLAKHMTHWRVLLVLSNTDTKYCEYG